MKKKTLAKVNSLIGILGGLILFITPIIIAKLSSSFAIYSSLLIHTNMSIVSIAICFIAVVNGVTSIVYFDPDQDISQIASINLIVGGLIGLVPYISILGGFLLIISGCQNFKIIRKIKD